MEEMAWWFDAARQHLTYGDVRDYAVAAGVVFRAMARFCGEGNARLLFANASTPPKKTIETRERQRLLLNYMGRNSLTPGAVAKELVGSLGMQRVYGLRGSSNPEVLKRQLQKLRSREEKILQEMQAVLGRGVEI
jgi:hypothetical protein